MHGAVAVCAAVLPGSFLPDAFLAKPDAILCGATAAHRLEQWQQQDSLLAEATSNFGDPTMVRQVGPVNPEKHPTRRGRPSHASGMPTPPACCQLLHARCHQSNRRRAQVM